MSRDIFASYICEMNSSSLSSKTSEYKQSQNKSDIESDIRNIKERIACLEISKDSGVYNGRNIYDIAVIGGVVVIPGACSLRTNIYIKGGKIESISAILHNAKKNIDGKGKYVCPGIVDPHIHLGLFESLEKELISETKSAIMGGITTAGCYFGGDKSHIDNYKHIQYQIENNSNIDIFPHFVIGSDLQKNEMINLAENYGATSFKLYMNGIPGLIPDVDDGFILDVFEELKKIEKKCILCAHSENRDVVRRATENVKNKQDMNLKTWEETHPAMAEEEAVIRLSYWAEKMKSNVYFVHISSKEAIKRLEEIRKTNPYVYVETTSPYLNLNIDNIEGNKYKMEPPFRYREDSDALWNGIKQGVVDTVGTDNVTLTSKEKQVEKNFLEVMPGYPALRTHFESLINEGVHNRDIKFEKIVELVTKKPAEIFGIYPQKGTILPGSDADIVIVDLEKQWTVSAKDLESRSDYSLFDNQKFKGAVTTVIKGGVLVVENGEYLQKNVGKLIKR